jgi:hypothetical protein
MNKYFKNNITKVVAISISFISFNLAHSSSASEIEFFKGNWDCKLQNAPYTTFRWSVKEENSWLNGSVQRGQSNVSTDFWRILNGKIERFAFARDGLLVKVEGSKWESNKLVLRGSFSKQNENIQVREIIERITGKEFRATWQKMVSDRQWITITDERCTKS